MDCQWELKDSKYVCGVCGYETRHANLRRNCGQQLPSKATQIMNFGVALAEHTLTGGNTCSQAEVDRRLRICRDCPSGKLIVQDGVEYCQACGCVLTAEQRWLSKVRWLEQHCPHGYW